MKKQVKQKFNIVEWLKRFRPAIIDDRIVELENYDEQMLRDDNYMGGRLEKRFYRCNSTAISKIISELKNNPNYSYVTYINDIIKEGVVPEKVYIIKKESIVSRILNFFEIPTSYNFIAKNHEKAEYEEYYEASLDFISNDEKFYNFDDLGVVDYGIEAYVQVIEKAIEKNFKFNNDNEKQQTKHKLIENFVMTYLTRYYLLGDCDFYPRNFGVLHNELTNSLKFVNFDFEYCFDKRQLTYQFCVPEMEFVRRKFPEIYQKFISKVKEIDKAFKLDNADLPTDSLFYKYMNYLKNNCSTLSLCDKKITRREKISRFFGITRAK